MYRSSRRLWGPGVLLLGRVSKKKKLPTRSIDNRLRVAILLFVETGISTALPAPPWERAPPLLLAHGQVIAVREARLEPCGQGCCCAADVLHGAAVCNSYVPTTLSGNVRNTVYFHLYN